MSKARGDLGKLPSGRRSRTELEIFSDTFHRAQEIMQGRQEPKGQEANSQAVEAEPGILKRVEGCVWLCRDGVRKAKAQLEPLVSGSMSKWGSLTSGDPQGAVLFNVYINDRGQGTECSLRNLGNVQINLCSLSGRV